MNRPYIDDLLGKVDSKYSLVIAAARRARQLVDSQVDMKDEEGHDYKPVTLALHEINDEKVKVIRQTP